MDRIARRREALRARIAEKKLDALLVIHPANVAYLTGFTGDSSYLLAGSERDLILSDGRFTTQIEQECPGLDAHIRPTGQTMNQSVGEVIKKLNLHRIGFEASYLSVADWNAIQKESPSRELIAADGHVEALRRVKDDAEILEIREAIDQAQRAFLKLRGELAEGWTEKAVADRLDALLREFGAVGASFPPIVAVGRRAALPHARPTVDAKIGDDDFVLFDWGADGRGYKSDLTRMVVTGKVTPEFANVYRIVLTAQERAIAAIRPGAKAQDIDAEARSYIDQAGFGRFFGHGLGHGIGLEIHEGPRLRKESATILEPGMVLTVEPGIYLPEWGGVRIEDDVLVTPEGHEVLSSLPKSLDSVAL